MQISDVPDLAHTRPYARHWLATATAMAAAVALGGLLQPDAAKASPATGRTAVASEPNHVPLPAPDPARVHFPLRCGTAGTDVVKSVSGDLDGDGNPETVAAVRCAAGAGTPPSGVYVLVGTGSAPRIVATLVDPGEDLSVDGNVAISDRTVTATLLGYSTPDVPKCCPDEIRHVSWKYANGAFVRGDGPAARSV